MKMLLSVLLLLPVALFAETYQSNGFKTSLIELYTSEGCSSCPPAEQWLSKIYQQGFKQKNIVPLAFHVTYWDYLGWKDKYSKKTHDQRQRKMVRNEGGSTVYTPQLFLNGKSLRSVSSLKSKISVSPADISIKSITSETDKNVIIDVFLNSKNMDTNAELKVNIVGYQNDIASSIKAGENKGNEALHQYVVREFKNASINLLKGKSNRFFFDKEKASNWSGFVIFVETNGEVLQVLNIPIKKRT